jgi:peptidyl-prolyl cis-trans isomerase SurA
MRTENPTPPPLPDCRFSRLSRFSRARARARNRNRNRQSRPRISEDFENDCEHEHRFAEHAREKIDRLLRRGGDSDRSRGCLLAWTVALLLSLSCLTTDPPKADAAFVPVLNKNDEGAGSFRQALADAKDGDEIQFAPDVVGEIRLASRLDVTRRLTVRGPGADILAILGSSKFADVFRIEATADLTIEGLTIAQGDSGFENKGGRLKIVRCVVRDNTEHGITNEGDGVLKMVGSLVVQNHENGIDNADSGTVFCVNTTLQGNGENGIDNNDGRLTIANCTITDNRESGIANSEGSAIVQNTILAGNQSNCSGSITSRGYNLSSDSSCAFKEAGDMNDRQPNLAAPAPNGGPTWTRASLDGAPTLDAGNPDGCMDPITGMLLTTDQRGARRPGGDRCDIGAYELQPSGVRLINRILSIIDDDPLTLYELEQFTSRDLGPTPLDSPELPTFLDALITKRLIDLEFTKQGMSVREEEIDRYITGIRQRNQLSEEQLQLALAQQGITMERYRNQIRDELRRAHLINREIRGKVNVTPQDVERYYQAHLNDYAKPEQFTISHIVLQLPQDASPEQVEEVLRRSEAIYEELSDGADFAETAKRYSEDAAAESGGSLGKFQRGQMLDELEEAVGGLEPGQFSRPIRSPAGIHIVRLDELDATSHESLEELAAGIKERLYNAALEERYNRWLREDLRARHHVEVLL